MYHMFCSLMTVIFDILVCYIEGVSASRTFSKNDAELFCHKRYR